MTRQITAAERKPETLLRVSKPEALLLTTVPAPLSEPSTPASKKTLTEAPPVRQRQAPARAALKCQWERPSLIAREINSLARRFAAELGQEPYEPDWERIFMLERCNAASIWTARTTTTYDPMAQGTMVGYLGVTLMRGLFVNSMFARIEAGYIAPQWRTGLTGFRFVKSAVAAIKQAGDYTIEWETNDKYEPDASGRSRLATMLERIGFKQVGTVMSLK